MAVQILLPGDTLPANTLTTTQRKRLNASSGLLDNKQTNILTSTLAGPLHTTPKHISISNSHARYIPRRGDLVIAQVSKSVADFIHLTLAPHTAVAILPQLAFEGASRKTRPKLNSGDLVYAKVTVARRGMEVELSCVNPDTGKSEPEGLGPLVGGMAFDVSGGFAGRLLRNEGVGGLTELGSKMQGGFEIAAGRNGRVWVDCPNGGVKEICAVGRVLQESDQRNLNEVEQKKLVGQVLKSMGLG